MQTTCTQVQISLHIFAGLIRTLVVSKLVVVNYLVSLKSHRVGGNRKRNTVDVDQKSSETEFSIAICRMTIENTVSSGFFIRVRRLLRTFTIVAYPVCK